MRIHDRPVPVLRLDRIRRSEEALGRDKDKLHIALIWEFLRCRRRAVRRRPAWTFKDRFGSPTAQRVLQCHDPKELCTE